MLLAVLRPKAILERGDLPKSTRVGRPVSRRTIPPLPEGEGRGEGERAQPIDCQSHQPLGHAPLSGTGPTFYCEFLLTDRVLRCWTGTRRIEAADVEEIDTVVKLLYLKSGDPIPCRITQRPPNAPEQAFIQSERLIASHHALAVALSTARPALETPAPTPVAPPPLAPPEINDTLLWHVQQKIVDELDPKLKSAPSASLIFTRLCRDHLTLAELSRSHQWPLRTLKLRKAALEQFLQAHFHLRLADFYVDRSIFRAAERQLSDHRARRISPHALADADNGEDED